MKRTLVLGLGTTIFVACEGDAEIPLGPAEGLAPAAANLVGQASGGAHLLTADGFNRRLTFTARHYADDSVDGEWQLVAGATILHGDITCLTIEGNRARVGGTVADAKFANFQEGTDIAWEAVDDGEGAAASDATSNLRAFRNAPPESAAAFCADGTVPEEGGDFFVIEEITRGNVQVSGE